MNGAQALLRTLVDAGVNVCFGNPGTSEMHFVAALDSVPEMRGILGLFEGVVTGAADGYARMADKPAATLLHLGPGLANGLANLHNARRARTGIVNVVGDHATYHKQYDAPLESDIEALATTVGWTRTSTSTEALAADAVEAVKVAQSGRIATLILPADVSWGDGGAAAAPLAAPVRPTVAENVVHAIVDVLRSGESTVILLGNAGTRERALRAASRISQATGVKLFAETFPTRIERGAGVPAVDRLGYLAEQVTWQLTDVRNLVLAGAKSPVSFFAYPGKASDLVPDNCKVHVLAQPDDDIAAALEAIADVVAPDVEPVLQEAKRPELPQGDLTPQNWVDVIGALLPENAVIVDESNTSGLLLPTATAGAPKHDVLTLTGGSIGFGLPTAVGAAVAVPDRPVICLQADGSAMYTASALWTMAREGLNVTTVVLSNRSYAILKLELQRVGADSTGPKALDWLDLSRPDLDFVSLATAMGVPATRAATAEDLADQFRESLAQPGPHVIEAAIPTLF
ncbi:acetolactate synthase large subunit [Kibdelosporangium persicum]|uniref:Thiamine pyrophosphate-dependent enzyme, carboligase or decarboxylase n=1 Tax=Kibdelosporangium persicum TaxID=2698649 RepID=A0ABX2F6S1_9PSEU|nr:acetolactate synthase large subunit [Kibdelosporangium persicum]NRN66854.1 Thiamine pyrophosphate-dependent enzyme, carboligase or decarboxylase [Kibdelosporangium persicum]